MAIHLLIKDCFTTCRTELKLNAVVKRQDNQGDQILKINQVLKLEPKVSR